ncbi:MAG: CDP-alcohol phosphatidyltransferase family protein [Acidimicrobiales bacterium]
MTPGRNSAPVPAEEGDFVPPAESQIGPRQVLTVPNLLSLGRLACVPLFLWLLFSEERPVAAAGLLAVLGVTDWVDGYIARRFNQVSTLGKVLDPTADRILLGVGIVAIGIEGSAPSVLVWAAATREILVSVVALVLAGMGARRIDVSWPGKCGTFALMVAFPLFLAGGGQGPTAWVAWPVAVVGLAFGWYAAFGYLPQGRKALAEGRGQ